MQPLHLSFVLSLALLLLFSHSATAYPYARDLITTEDLAWGHYGESDSHWRDRLYLNVHPYYGTGNIFCRPRGYQPAQRFRLFGCAFTHKMNITPYPHTPNIIDQL